MVISLKQWSLYRGPPSSLTRPAATFVNARVCLYVRLYVCMYASMYVWMTSMQRSSGLCAQTQPLFCSQQNHSKPWHGWSPAGPFGCMACSHNSDGQQHEPKWKPPTCVAALYSKHARVYINFRVFYFGWVTNGISDKKIGGRKSRISVTFLFAVMLAAQTSAECGIFCWLVYRSVPFVMSGLY